MEDTAEFEKSPENPINTAVIETLGILEHALRPTGQSAIETTSEGGEVISDGKTLLKVTPSDFFVAGESFQDKLKAKGKSEHKQYYPNRFAHFITDIADSVNGANHFGISYDGSIISEEDRLRRLAENSGFVFTNEPSDSPSEYQWYFMGDRNLARQPSFEFIVNESSKRTNNIWVPHVQVDLDTSLTYDEVVRATERHFGKGFMRWNLPTPVGIVLGMGIMGQIEGTKFALGIGTDKRGTKLPGDK